MCSIRCYEDLPTCGEGGPPLHGANQITTVTYIQRSGPDITIVRTGVFFYPRLRYYHHPLCVAEYQMGLQLDALEAPQRHQDEHDAQDGGGDHF
jgi:hypothetical protein